MPDTLSGLRAQGLPLDRWALSPADTLRLVREITADASALHKKIARLEAAQSVALLPIPRELLYANRVLGSQLFNLRLELRHTFGEKDDPLDLPASSDPTGQVWHELARELHNAPPS